MNQMRMTVTRGSVSMSRYSLPLSRRWILRASKWQEIYLRDTTFTCAFISIPGENLLFILLSPPLSGSCLCHSSLSQSTISRKVSHRIGRHLLDVYIWVRSVSLCILRSAVEIWKFMSVFSGYKVLLGDLNAEPDSPAIRWGEGAIWNCGCCVSGCVGPVYALSPPDWGMVKPQFVLEQCPLPSMLPAASID